MRAHSRFFKHEKDSTVLCHQFHSRSSLVPWDLTSFFCSKHVHPLHLFWILFCTKAIPSTQLEGLPRFMVKQPCSVITQVNIFSSLLSPRKALNCIWGCSFGDLWGLWYSLDVSKTVKSLPLQRRGMTFQVYLTVIYQEVSLTTATHPRISAFRTTYFVAIPPPSQLSSNNDNKMFELFINIQLLFLPRKICSLYSLLNSRLLQQFVKEGTSEEDQLEGDSALQDTEQESPGFSKRVNLAGTINPIQQVLKFGNGLSVMHNSISYISSEEN